MPISMMVMKVILMMISATRNSSINYVLNLAIDAFIISNTVITDVCVNEDWSAMYRSGLSGVRVRQVGTGVCPPEGIPVMMMSRMDVTVTATAEINPNIRKESTAKGIGREAVSAT
jgi:hypothetical protein